MRKKYATEYAYVLPKLVVTELWPIRSLVPSGSDGHVVFDVGANHGIWSKAWIDKYGARLASLHMFEPLPGNRAMIESRLKDGFISEIHPTSRERIVINPCAVGDESGLFEIHYEVENSGLASLAQKTSTMPGREVALPKTLCVDTITIDEYCEKNGIERIDVMKIDVEGFELNVLNGATRMFADRRVGVVTYEFGLHQLSQRHTFRDFWDFFSTHGYAMAEFGMGRRGFDLHPITRYEGRLEDFSTIVVHCGYRAP